MLNTIDEIQKIAVAKLGQEFSPETFEFLKKLLDKRKCRIGLIKKLYDESLKEGLAPVDARFECEEEFKASESFVKNCIYRYRNVEIPI